MANEIKIYLEFTIIHGELFGSFPSVQVNKFAHTRPSPFRQEPERADNKK